MMSEELKLYYSVEAQARAGNPEAIELLRARGSQLTRLPVAEHSKAVRRGAPVELHRAADEEAKPGSKPSGHEPK